MSPSVYIVPRANAAGARRFQVRYRLGGRESVPRSAGTFATRREAESRARWVAGELAAMRIPDTRMAGRSGTLRAALEEMARGRLDVGQAAQRRYRQAAGRLGALGDRDVLAIRPGDVREWIAGLAGELAPSSIAQYVSVVRLALDEADLPHPNPARHRTVHLPRLLSEEVAPPSHGEFVALCEAISPRYRLGLELIERTGLRVGEAEALTWGDVDLGGRRLRVPRGGKTAAARRMVPLVDDWPERLAAACPREDRAPSRRVLAGDALRWERSFRRALARACTLAGTGEHSPHDLRHRYTSLLVLAGVPITLVRQVVGHARASVTLDTYAHVLLDEPRERLASLRRGVMVVSGWSADAPDGGEIPAQGDIADLMGSTGIEPVTSRV